MGIEEHGHWVSDTEFEFNVPVELAPGMVMRRADVSQFMTMEPDITAEMVIEMLLNGGRPEQVASELVGAQCPDCGMKGMVPADVLPPGVDGPLIVRCPKCRDAARN